MDLPPVPAPAPTQSQPQASPQPPPPPTHGNPVGRPSSDPERQQERSESNASINRMLKALPKQATDPKVAVYRLRGRTGRHAEPQAALKILVSDIEEAVETGLDSEDYLQQVISEEVGPGRYLCVPQDAHGHRIKKAAQWEVAVEGEGMFEDEDDDPRGRARHVPGIGLVYDYDDDEPEFPHNPYAPQGGQHNPYGAPPPNPYAPQGPNPFGAPPPPPGGNEAPANVLSEVRSILDSQRSSGNDGNQMFAMMFQMTAQQREEQRRYDEQMRREREERERERREEERKWREEERLREERREQREQQARNERLQLLGTIAPVLVPLLQKMMEKPKDEITPILMTKLLDGDKSRDHLHEIMQVMGESTRQQLLSSAEMSRQQMQQMGEMNQMSMQHVLKLAQDTMAAERDLQGDEDDPVNKFTKVLKTIAPMLGGVQQRQGGYQAQPQQPVPPQQRPALQQPQPKQPQGTETRQPAAKQPPPPLPTRETQPEVPDEEWIHGALDTVRRLETGELPAEERPKALAWCASNLPQELQQAVAAGDEETILEHAGPVVMGDEQLRGWLSVELHQNFLRGALNDMRLLLTTQPHEEMLEKMVVEQAQYNDFRAQSPEPQEDASEEAPSEEGPSAISEDEAPDDGDDDLSDAGIEGDHYNQDLPEDFFKKKAEEAEEAKQTEQAEEVSTGPAGKQPPPPPQGD